VGLGCCQHLHMSCRAVLVVTSGTAIHVAYLTVRCLLNAVRQQPRTGCFAVRFSFRRCQTFIACRCCYFTGVHYCQVAELKLLAWRCCHMWLCCLPCR
jgi:hypothetical protein